jgi:hypothetical protein
VAVQLDPRHAPKPDVDEEASKVWAQRVSEKLLGRFKEHWLKSGELQQPAERTSQALIVVDDPNVAPVGHG